MHHVYSPCLGVLAGFCLMALSAHAEMLPHFSPDWQADSAAVFEGTWMEGDRVRVDSILFERQPGTVEAGKDMQIPGMAALPKAADADDRYRLQKVEIPSKRLLVFLRRDQAGSWDIGVCAGGSSQVAWLGDDDDHYYTYDQWMNPGGYRLSQHEGKADMLARLGKGIEAEKKFIAAAATPDATQRLTLMMAYLLLPEKDFESRFRYRAVEEISKIGGVAIDSVVRLLESSQGAEAKVQTNIRHAMYSLAHDHPDEARQHAAYFVGRLQAGNDDEATSMLAILRSCHATQTAGGALSVLKRMERANTAADKLQLYHGAFDAWRQVPSQAVHEALLERLVELEPLKLVGWNGAYFLRELQKEDPTTSKPAVHAFILRGIQAIADLPADDRNIAFCRLSDMVKECEDTEAAKALVHAIPHITPPGIIVDTALSRLIDVAGEDARAAVLKYYRDNPTLAQDVLERRNYGISSDLAALAITAIEGDKQEAGKGDR